MRLQAASTLLALGLLSACSRSTVDRPREILQTVWNKTHPDVHPAADLALLWKTLKDGAENVSLPPPEEPPPAVTAAVTPPQAPQAHPNATAAAVPSAPPSDEPTLLRATITSRRGAVAVVSNDAGQMQVVRPGDTLDSHRWRVQRIEPEFALLVSATDARSSLTRRIFLATPESLSPHH